MKTFCALMEGWIIQMYAFVTILDMYTEDFCISLYVNYSRQKSLKLSNLNSSQIHMT